MDYNGRAAITAFDAYFTTDSIRKYKILLSALPPAQQKAFAPLIKGMELSYTFSCCNSPICSSYSTCSPLKLSPEENCEEYISFLNELLPYSNRAEQEKIHSLQNFLTQLSFMKQIMETIDLLKSIFPEGFQEGSFQPFEFLSGLTQNTDFDLQAFFNLFGKEQT